MSTRHLLKTALDDGSGPFACKILYIFESHCNYVTRHAVSETAISVLPTVFGGSVNNIEQLLLF